MKNILIVDDTFFMRSSIKKILEEEGYNIVGEAENGLEAIEKFQQLKPDLVLMDITMPVMTGLEALENIKKIDSNARVVMVSAMGQEATVKQAIIKGAETFIVKPFKPETLLGILKSI